MSHKVELLLLLTESVNLLPLTRIFMEYSGALFDIDDGVQYREV